MLHVRILVLSLAAKILLPTTLVSAATISESFASNPLADGWRIVGDANLFQWDSTNHNLKVTWDSSQPDSYFYHPLGTVLDRLDDFSLAFDLRLDDIGPGPDPRKAATFSIGIGFLNLSEATQTNFLRGTGFSSPDLAEFAYFWDSGYGATTFPTLVDTNDTFNYNGASDYAIFALSPGDWYHVVMTYTASNVALVTTVTNFEQTAGVRITQLINTNFTDYRLGSVSINSYSDAGQDPQYAGSVLAHGVLDNLTVTVPDAPLQQVVVSEDQGGWHARFLGRTNWVYILERSADLQSWSKVSSLVPSANGALSLSDTNAATTKAFYRIAATRP